MANTDGPDIIVVRDNPYLLIGMGMIAGWALATAYKRGSARRPARPSPAPFRATAADTAGLTRAGPASRVSALFSGAGPLAALVDVQQLQQAQQKIDDSMHEGFKNTSNRAQDKNSQSLSEKASDILEVHRAIDADFAAKAASLGLADVQTLNALGDTLSARATEIKTATNALTAVNAFLGVGNQVVGVFK